MRFTFVLAAGIAVSATTVAVPAQAGPYGGHALFRPHQGLPPISGTIRLHPNGFGGSRPAAWAQGRQSGANVAQPRPSFTARRPTIWRGYQGQAYSQQARANGSGYAGSGASAASRPQGYGWRGNGTGLVGLIGGGQQFYGAQQTGWGTADSATTGGAYPLPSARTEAPLRVAYGEPDLWSGESYGQGYAPTGGLAYYNSGSPGGMAYYNSGSSAGPGGTPGGLGFYNSGAYGPGARIIHVGRHHVRRGYAASGCTCGPHIVRVGEWRRHARW